MDAQTKFILKKVISAHSIDIIHNTKKFRAIMRDNLVPKIDVNLLAEIMSSSMFLDFISSKGKLNSAYERKKLLNELKEEYPFNEYSLAEGIDCFVFALDGEIIEFDKNNEIAEDNKEENQLLANVIKFMLHN